MIQLQAIAKPIELTNELIQKLTQKYIENGTAVWQKTYIKKALGKMSFEKCCFCECRLNEESKYLEVEHFHPKSLYPAEVLLWENLLPICGRCNKQKSDHDTKQVPIIHPVKDNPKDHLELRNYRFYKKTPLGQKTIDVISLNDNSQKIVDKRFQIGTAILEQLEDLLERTNDYYKAPTIRNKNKIRSQLRNIMTEGTKESTYSATAATILLNEASYAEIKQIFTQQNLWTDEFIELEQQVQYCVLNSEYS